ncbi:general secretion pathway protein GspK [Rhodanobacter sp. Root627]|nr:general secretion pathway protein GspK [Rhodanobacter sp. Root627]
MRACPSPRRQRGVALLLVLWACALLAVLLGGYAAVVHTEAVLARHQLAQTRAHYAAEAGLMHALRGLHDTRAKQRWIGDGRLYTMSYDGAEVRIRAVDESGKVDLNSATPAVLQGLFQAAGMAPGDAQALAAHVVAWRTRSAFEGVASDAADYAAAGRHYAPRYGPFASVEELQMVLGMTPALYRKLAPHLTLWSGQPSPDPNVATSLALAAIPGMTTARMQEIIAARQRNVDDPALTVGMGVTHSVRSQATLADGTRAVLRATIRWQAERSNGPPYAVLRWQEGDPE